MKIALISANLNNIDVRVKHDSQILPTSVHLSDYYYTEENFPLRSKSITPRMQAKIPKLFGWDLIPGFDIYIWLDASFKLTEHAVQWLLDQLQYADLAVFRHPSRNSILLEADHLIKRLTGKVMRSQYICDRYTNEWLEEQLNAYLSDSSFLDNRLFACGCFIYRPTNTVKELMHNWWWHITRYHINDQLSFPYVLSKSHVEFNTINSNIFKCPYLIYSRGDR